jgi:hypothetical protein
VSHLSRVQDLLPPPYTGDANSILLRLLDIVALEMDAFDEDLDRYQRSHWIRAVQQLNDAEKMAALAGIRRLPWEDLDLFRERLLALIVALRSGASGPRQIRQFVYDYLSRAERVLGATFVPGLAKLTAAEAAFSESPDLPHYRPLRFVEFPPVARTSEVLDSRGGNIPYLYRWTETNRGLDETSPIFTMTGVHERTSVPILVNLTTGDLLGYAGQLRFGQTLTVTLSALATEAVRTAAATLGSAVVTDRLFSVQNFKPGVPFTRDQLDKVPMHPRLPRGASDWLFLTVGLYDMRGLDRFSFAIADNLLHEGVFDDTFFDQAVFPAGTQVKLRMSWIETEPASFQVHIPRCITQEPALGDAPAWTHLEAGLQDAIGQLHAAGVRAGAIFDPFTEVQKQVTAFEVPFKTLDTETGSAGEAESLTFGSRFDESPLGSSRFN